MIGQVALAMLLGGLIGAEREWANKPAGFRTHMLIAGTGALLVVLADALVEHFGGDAYAGGIIRADPIRIVEAIITGVAFIGAGTIFRSQGGDHVEGLTTAASLLFSAAIGVAVALREFVIAVGITLLALAVLRSVAMWQGLRKRVLGGRGPPH